MSPKYFMQFARSQNFLKSSQTLVFRRKDTTMPTFTEWVFHDTENTIISSKYTRNAPKLSQLRGMFKIGWKVAGVY